MSKNSGEKKYECQLIFYNEEEEFWSVSFFEDPDMGNGWFRLDGPETNIAIRKSDGKILRIKTHWSTSRICRLLRRRSAYRIRPQTALLSNFI